MRRYISKRTNWIIARKWIIVTLRADTDRFWTQHNAKIREGERTPRGSTRRIRSRRISSISRAPISDIGLFLHRVKKRNRLNNQGPIIRSYEFLMPSFQLKCLMKYYIFSRINLYLLLRNCKKQEKNNREYRNTIYDSCAQRKDDARLTKRFVVILVSGN